MLKVETTVKEPGGSCGHGQIGQIKSTKIVKPIKLTKQNKFCTVAILKLSDSSEKYELSNFIRNLVLAIDSLSESRC